MNAAAAAAYRVHSTHFSDRRVSHAFGRRTANVVVAWNSWSYPREHNMSKAQSLQDPFLNALRRERIPVSIYLVNGIKLQGTVESFDQFVVLLRNTVSQMVYKHAISTVVPARNVKVGDGPHAHEPHDPVVED